MLATIWRASFPAATSAKLAGGSCCDYTEPPYSLWPSSGGAISQIPPFGAATQFTVQVRGPEEEHYVSLAKVKTWLEGGAKSPNETGAKEGLKQMLGE